MASMGFHLNTIIAMMSIIDEHKDDTNEATYVEMCNALKHLHTQCKSHEYSTQPQQQPQQQQQQQPYAHIQLQLSRLDRQIEYLQSLIVSNGRVTNQDKVKALRAILDNFSIEYRSSTEVSNNRVTELNNILFTQLSGNNQLTAEGVQHLTRNLTRLYQECKNERVERDRALYRSRVEILQNERQHILNNVITP